MCKSKEEEKGSYKKNKLYSYNKKKFKLSKQASS